MDTNELCLFFRLSSDLHAAIRDQRAEAKSDAMTEMVGLWLHASNSKIRSRCAALLELQGMRGEMDELCNQWAH